MIDAGADVLLYAVAAAASALVLSATFVVIRSERPRANSMAFLTGFLVGTVLACGLGLALGQAAVDRFDAHDTLRAAATLIFGGVLLAIGFRARSARSAGTSSSRSTRTQLRGWSGSTPAGEPLGLPIFRRGRFQPGSRSTPSGRSAIACS